MNRTKHVSSGAKAHREEAEGVASAVKTTGAAPGRKLDPKFLAEVLAHAQETFGSSVNANAWLNKPNRVFHNQSPLQILTQDPAAVEEELVRIDHGMFV
jgi:uncharacterized protein (DUF2384 family)